jgi:exopolysaccharide biosynthesis polyprenyl glycosylphosphotransferase
MLEQNIAISHNALSQGMRNTAIIGFNSKGLLAYQRVKDQLRTRENLVGIIDIHERRTLPYRNLKDVNYLGQLRNFSQLRQDFGINHVLIAIDSNDVSKIHEIINICKKDRIIYEFAAELQDVVYGNTIQQIFRDLDRPWQPSRRQIVYSIAAFTLMILLFPLFLVASLMIKLDSRGSIFYSQERVGIGGRIFRIFKFRTMFVDAEKFSGPQLATKDDPRITRVGRFLRKTRIDEIPQLINVVIGDMHFIGPRPERPYFVEKYSREIPMYKNRLKVKPGITGLAQVLSGYDEDLEDVKVKLRYDMQYIDQYNSINLHLDILFRTVKVVLTGKGH